MSRKTTSQWDFGELFPAPSQRRVYSVTELTLKIKGLLEQQLGEVWVSGEITNLRIQSSGHAYFSLKDANAALGCVLFRGTSVDGRSALKDGQRVNLQGDLTVYEPRGQYQLVVRTVELQGMGALQAAFERLKQKLAGEGLFDPSRKRAIPRFPRRMGIVTSPTGAALRDVLHVIGRRHPRLELCLAACRVQGAGAEREVAAAIRRLNEWSARAAESGSGLELILVTRGGGSLEDLWAFNEEVVARAIFESALPVVAAIGHEIDFTIADFVADLRAATPSAAAELLTAGYVESREVVARLGIRVQRLTQGVVAAARETLGDFGRRLGRAHPRRRLNEQMQRLDEALLSLVRRGRECLRSRQQGMDSLAMRLASVRPSARVARDRERMAWQLAGLTRAVREGLRLASDRVEGLAQRLRLLSPENVLARGYSITLEAETGRVLRRAGDTAEGRLLRTRLHSGDVTSVVARVTATPDPGPRPSDL